MKKLRGSVMKTLKSFSIVGTVMAVVFVMGLGIANANIIPIETSITGSGPYTWTYNAALSADQNAFSGIAPTSNPVSNQPPNTIGSFFTIYDFAGYVGGSATGPTGWTATVQNVGFTPSNVVPVDDPNILNITWTYTTGGTLFGQPNGLNLGNFTAQSTFNLPTLTSYTSRGLANSGPQKGTIADNVGNTEGPTAVPEPATMLLLGSGLLGMGVYAKRRFL